MSQLKHCCILAPTLIIFQLITVAIYQIYYQNSVKKLQNEIVIGMVYCRKNATVTSTDPFFIQTIVSLKSIIISAYLYNIHKIQMHLFLEHIEEDGPLFRKIVFKEMDVKRVIFYLHIHSALEKIPKKYEDYMIYHHRFRCGFTRFFMPESLPNVDSLIYLDSDTIITGDLMKHWNLLSEMDSFQMVAVGRNSPVENANFSETYLNLFGTTPHVPPTGVNTGVIVMNLTRMREFRMAEKLERIYNDYSKFVTSLSDQRVLNILLHFNPELLLLMPCNLNFMGAECKDGPFYCWPAHKDPDGVHLVHGSDRSFRKEKRFHKIFEFYEKFNISTLYDSNYTETLMKPIRQAYSNTYGNNTAICAGTLGEVLFKRFCNSAV